MTSLTTNNETCQQMAHNGTCPTISNCYSIHSNNNYLFTDQQQESIEDNKNKCSKASTFHTNIPTLNWLDTLEKDFDKAFVDLDLLLGDFDGDQVFF